MAYPVYLTIATVLLILSISGLFLSRSFQVKILSTLLLFSAILITAAVWIQINSRQSHFEMVIVYFQGLYFILLLCSGILYRNIHGRSHRSNPESSPPKRQIR